MDPGSLGSLAASAAKNIAWVAGLMTGIGAVGKFIDFFVGKPGKERVKDWLLKGWTKFDDMHWYNFSEKEARYAIELFDRVFAPKLISTHRLIAAFTCYVLLCITAIILYRRAELTGVWPPNVFLNPPFSPVATFAHLKSVLVADLIGALVAIVGFAVSLSLTRAITLGVVRLSAKRWLGPFPYVALIAAHWLLLLTWFPGVIEVTQIIVAYLASGNPFSDMNHLTSPVNIAANALEQIDLTGEFAFAHFPYLIPLTNKFQLIDWTLSAADGFIGWITYVLRLGIGVVLLFSFLLREWLSRFLSRLWARIYEDNEGAITLIFGGIGALAGGLRWILSPDNRHWRKQFLVHSD